MQDSYGLFSDKKTEIQGYRDLNKIISRRLQLIKVLIIDGNSEIGAHAISIISSA